MREFCESQMVHLREQTALQFKALEDAHEKSAVILDERLGRMNEFREAMRDQAANFVPREELDLKLGSLSMEVQLLRDITSESRGKASAASVYVAWAMSLAALGIGLLTMLLNRGGE
jgi:hypothetical protein